MEILGITVQVMAGFCCGLFVGGFLLEQVFSVLNRGRSGRWHLLLAGLCFAAILVMAGVIFRLYIGLWASLVAFCVLIGITVVQNVAVGRLDR